MRRWLRGLALLLTVACLALLVPAGGTAAGARYPIIFIPGLAGSEMYNGRELVWLNVWKAAQSQVPIFNRLVYDWLLPLELQADGETPARPSYRIRVGDILQSGVTGVYAPFLARLEQRGYRQGQDLFVYPYDWRRPTAMAAAGLEAVVAEALRRNPGAGRVVLIGHSMGGQVAREYIRRTGGRDVHGLIAIAAPWLGTAVTYKALARGWDMGFDVPGTMWRVRAPPTVHRLAQNWPAVYELLPGARYAEVYGGYIRRGGQLLTPGQAAETVAAEHNPALAAAAGWGDGLLDGNAYGVRQFLVAGYSRPTLLAADEGDWYGFPTWSEQTGDGDGTVLTASADLGASFDPGRPARLLGPVEAVAYVNVVHTFMTNSPELQAQVGRWLDQLHVAAPAAGRGPARTWLREGPETLRRIERMGRLAAPR